MEMKNPPPMMTEKMPTTKPPTRSTAVSRVSSQGASVLIHERSITVLHRKDSTPLNYGRRLCAAGFRSRLCRLGVKTGKSRSEQLFSELPSEADLTADIVDVSQCQCQTSAALVLQPTKFEFVVKP